LSLFFSICNHYTTRPSTMRLCVEGFPVNIKGAGVLAPWRLLPPDLTFGRALGHSSGGWLDNYEILRRV
jgi:hypothetical protein